MITAALPTYNNAKALPIQLISLCAQINAPEWELIVMEEQSADYFGRDELIKYLPRLKAANCVSVKYVSLDRWTPLGEKWVLISDRMHPDSVGFMLCASDNFSPAYRIQRSYDAMISGADWYQSTGGLFYDVHSHTAGRITLNEGNPGLFMCLSREAIKRVPVSKVYPTRGVDSWLWRSAAPKRPKYDSDTAGVHTDGLNTISLSRKRQYNGPTAYGFFKHANPDEAFELMSPEVREYIRKTVKI